MSVVNVDMLWKYFMRRFETLVKQHIEDAKQQVKEDKKNLIQEYK